eukprot:Gb_39620 [translate_table: standard]
MGNCWNGPVKAEIPGRWRNSKSTSKDVTFSLPSAQSMTSVSVKTNESYPTTPSSEGEILSSLNLKTFSFNDLKNATLNFCPENLLGKGGFGCVFKGWIDEHEFIAVKPGMGIEIAVKKLNPEGLQGHKEWLAEVNFSGQLYHPNLVKLIGYCAEDDHRLLVYEFMKKGSLENYLFRRGFQTLPWAIRIKIATGAAKGIAFLHNAKRQVIYRNCKASNILLDLNFNAKLSDFGLARDGPTGDRTHVSTTFVGTNGYAAPEYLAKGRLSAKSDVYSFGVVLLELLTGRRAVDRYKPQIEQQLVKWATPYLMTKHKWFNVMDPRLDGQYPMEGAYKAATLALLCLSSEVNHRPSMTEVVEILEKLHNNLNGLDRNSLLAMANGNSHFNFNPKNTNPPRG